MGFDPANLTRRRAIKSIAVGASGAQVGFGRAGAAGNGAKRIGVIYDPQTHEILGPASAQFNPIQKELRGSLRLGDRKIELNQSQPVLESAKDDGERHVKYQQVIDSDRNGFNELVNVMGFPTGGLTGYLRRPSGKRVAFALNDRPGEQARREMEEHVHEAGLITGAIR